MADGALHHEVIEQRDLLLGVLDQLDAAQWDHTSLCDGWRVRDVVGHLVSILEIPTRRFLVGSVRSGSFDAFARRVAIEIGSRDVGDLLDSYRSLSRRRVSPPGMGPIAPLTDVVVHTSDITRSLGLDAPTEPPTQRTVLDFVCGGRAFGFVPRGRTRGLRFDVAELGWSRGAGTVVAGTGEAIMLAVTGRRSALDELNGPGAEQLRERLG